MGVAHSFKKRTAVVVNRRLSFSWSIGVPWKLGVMANVCMQIITTKMQTIIASFPCAPFAQRFRVVCGMVFITWLTDWVRWFHIALWDLMFFLLIKPLNSNFFSWNFVRAHLWHCATYFEIIKIENKFFSKLLIFRKISLWSPEKISPKNVNLEV